MNIERQVVVVLGVGRCGSSLAMQVLENMGMRVSDEVIPANVSNPEGFKEDARIVEIQKELIRILAPTPSMPPSEGWLNRPEVNDARKLLAEIVEKQAVDSKGKVWGFKDPRTATLLPLWLSIFNQKNIVPRFVLAVRDPRAVIESFSRQYGNDQSFAELIYLSRTLDALYYTGGDCHLVFYEDWFSDPKKTREKLANYVFGEAVDLDDHKLPLERKLNRAGQIDCRVGNPLVWDIYILLRQSEMNEVSSEHLMSRVHEMKRIMDGFSPWRNFAGQQQQRLKVLESKLKEANDIIHDMAAVRRDRESKRDALKELNIAVSAYERLLGL